MNVIFLTRLFYPHTGGVERHIFEIGKRLTAKGYHVSIITESLSGSNMTERIQNMRVYRIPMRYHGWRKKFDIWIWLFRHKHLLRSADIIHCHDVFFWYLPFRLLYPLKKVFTTFHGYEKYPVSKRAVIIRRLSWKLSHGTICIGSFIQKWYGTRPDVVSYGGVNTPKKVIRYADGNSALFIGRLDDQTGIETYIQAAKLLRRTYPDFSLSVVGEGNLRDSVPSEFKRLGVVRNADRLLSGYRFAFVSRYLAILEGFAAKRLVFAVYDNPIKEDYLKDTPFRSLLLTSASPKSLARKLQYFLNHPEKEKELIEKAYTWVQTQTWERVVNEYLTLWKARCGRPVGNLRY